MPGAGQHGSRSKSTADGSERQRTMTATIFPSRFIRLKRHSSFAREISM
jgi:hypothetical protein